MGDNIRIVVLEVKGSQVRLGVEAPSDLSIHRDEVWEKIMEENRKATTVTPDQMEIIVRKFSSPRMKNGKTDKSGNGEKKK